MDDDDLQEFATDGAYIQVNSLSHQFAGEVRGQIYRLRTGQLIAQTIARILTVQISLPQIRVLPIAARC